MKKKIICALILLIYFIPFSIFAAVPEAKPKFLFSIPKSFFINEIKSVYTGLNSKELNRELNSVVYWFTPDDAGNICISTGKSVFLYSPNGTVIRKLTPGGNISTRWFVMDEAGRLAFHDMRNMDEGGITIYDKNWIKDGEYRKTEWCRTWKFKKGNIVCFDCAAKCGVVYVCRDTKRITPECDTRECIKGVFAKVEEFEKVDRNIRAADKEIDASFKGVEYNDWPQNTNYMSYCKTGDKHRKGLEIFLFRLDKNKMPIIKFDQGKYKDSEKRQVIKMLDKNKIYIMEKGLLFINYYVVDMGE